jgi:poly-gamma-glutamate capsule biosynthesis protein CapA/YwtB (metallophosphatase superfamily)
MRQVAAVAALALLTAAFAAPAEGSAPPETPRGRLVIHATGDVNTDPTQYFTDDYDYAWSGLRGIFLRDDLTLVNLECDPSAAGARLSDKPFSFRCPVESLPAMAAAGVEVASMGNNHSGDWGVEGLLDGRANLIAAGLHPVGAGADLAEANRAAWFEVDGWRIAVLGFSAASGLAYRWPYTPGDYAALRNPWFATDDHPGVAPATIDNMTAAVQAVRADADLVIVMLHQGVDNLTGHPFPVEVARAEALVDAGADVVFAHHHHRLLPLEIYRGRPIFYGLGNFVWSRMEPVKNVTGVAEIVAWPDGRITARLIPALLEASGHPVLHGSPDAQTRPEYSLIQ